MRLFLYAIRLHRQNFSCNRYSKIFFVCRLLLRHTKGIVRVFHIQAFQKRFDFRKPLQLLRETETVASFRFFATQG